MRFFNFSKEAPAPQEAAPEPRVTRPPVISGYSLSAEGPSSIAQPSVKKSGRNEWADFGIDNLFPQHLVSYLAAAPLHSAICRSKAKMMGGESLVISLIVEDDRQQMLRLKLEQRPNPWMDLEDLVAAACFDWQIFGAMAFEVIWSVDGTRVDEIYPVSPKDLRCDPNEWGYPKMWYVKDWSSRDREQPKAIAPFNERLVRDQIEQGLAPNYNQILYVRNVSPTIPVYGAPSYESALKYVAAEDEVGTYHLSGIRNGFNPGAVVGFPQIAPSPEQEDEIVRQFLKKYAGAVNTNRPVILFYDGQENKVEIESIESPDNIAKMIQLSEEVTSAIIYSHRVTSPALVGIATPGKLGYSNELESSFKIFDAEVIGPDRRVLEKTLDKICGAWGLQAKVTVNKFNPLAGGEATTG